MRFRGQLQPGVALCRALDRELAGWRERKLCAYPYVVLDARYESIRHGGQVVDAAVLLALGVRHDGKRELLGVSVALSEAEGHWREFLTDLKDRGMHGMKLFVSDDHAGLKAPRAAVFPAVPWQRCQFHLQQNAAAYVPRQERRKTVAGDIRAIFNAPDEQEAKRLLERFVDKHQAKAPKLAAWAAEALPQGLAVFALPAGPSPPATHHQRAGAREQGDQTTNPGRHALPQRGLLRAADHCPRHGDLRGMGHRPHLPQHERGRMTISP